MRLRHLPLLLAAALPACVDPASPDAPPAVTSGELHHFAQTGWSVPTVDEDRTLGFDLDGDGRRDNAGGALLRTLATIGLDVGGASADAFARGEVVQLHSLRADALDDDASVSWRLFVGLSREQPRFDGTDAFLATSEAGLVSGAIRGGRFDGAIGEATIRVPFFRGQPGLVIPLRVAHVAFDPATGAGRIGGAIDGFVLHDEVLPALGDQVVRHLARNPDHEFTRAAIQIFDGDGDGAVSRDEFVRFAGDLLAYDVDLDHAGDDDAISFSLGFGAVPATFTAVE